MLGDGFPDNNCQTSSAFLQSSMNSSSESPQNDGGCDQAPAMRSLNTTAIHPIIRHSLLSTVLPIHSTLALSKNDLIQYENLCWKWSTVFTCILLICLFLTNFLAELRPHTFCFRSLWYFHPRSFVVHASGQPSFNHGVLNLRKSSRAFCFLFSNREAIFRCMTWQLQSNPARQ